MKIRENLLAVLLVLIISVFLINNNGHAAQGDCKQTPWHQLLAQVDKVPDKAARKKIFDECGGPREMTQKDRDAWLGALNSKNKDVQVRAVRMVRSTKDPMAIKKLVDIVRTMDIKNMAVPSLETMNEEQMKKFSEDTSVPVETIYMLGDFKNEEALPVIVEKLGDVRRGNILYDIALQNVLLTNYGAMSLPYVASQIEKISDKQAIGRGHLLGVILNMRGKESVGELRKLSASDNLEIRTAAFSALGAMKEKGDLTNIFADIDMAHANKEAHRNKIRGKLLSEKDSDELDRLMHVEDQLYRSLTDSKNMDAVPILIERVEAVRKYDKGNFFHKVYHEVWAISDIGGPEAFAFMKRAYDEIPTKVYEFGDRKGQKNVDDKDAFLQYFGRKGFVEAVTFLESIMNDSNQERVLRISAGVNLRIITEDRKKYNPIIDEITEGKR